MSDNGGTPYGPNDPTSYGLQPPQPQPPAPPAQGGQVASGQYGGNPYAQQPTQHQPYPPQQPSTPPQPPAAPQPPPEVHAVPTQAAPREQAHPAPGTGRLIAGRYRLLAKLGHGGMGTVWRAKDETVDREVAVKEPRVPDHLPERERANAFERMRREARAAARLDHPAVVNVHDVAVEDGQPWIVMEFVQGRSLGDVLQEGTLAGREAARIGLEVLGALEAAHQSGILHRDVKPDNVMLGRHDRVVLTDFGIAQIEGETNLTDTGSFVGSPEFIAPERVIGQRPGPASDLWSLGVVLYAATEGVSPFRRNNTPATLQSVLNATPAAPAAARGPLADAINRLLNKDPNHRPSAPQVRQLLEEAVRPPAPTRAVTPVGTGTGVKGGVTISRKGLIGIGAAVVAVAVAAGLVIADPFAGTTAEAEGWKAHPLGGKVDATLSVPAAYVRQKADVNDDGTTATFADPSGAIVVHLDVDRKADDTSDEIAPSAAGQAHAEWKEMEEGSARYPENMADEPAPKGNPKEVMWQEKKAGENVVAYTNDFSTDQPLPREVRFLYYRTKSGDMYTLSIDYPGKGDFTERGRVVAQAVVADLKINKP
ncbi:serine/threonine-protein kinase [Streptomyces sp. NPDC002851]